MFVKIAVTDIPPLSLAAGRVALGAGVLTLVALLQGQRFPRDRTAWLHALIVGIIGTVVPFFLIGWGQQYVDSALAAISMSSVPLFTLPLAHLLTHDEKLAPIKIAGVILGFIGVALLVLASTSETLESTPVGLIAILVAAFCYALAGILIRKMPEENAAVSGAMILLTGATVLIALSCLVDRPWRLAPGFEALLSVAVLGVFSTGLATLALVKLIERVGVTFASLNNYLVPVVGIACGVVWLDETLQPSAWIAFTFILVGVYLTSKTAPSGRNP
ncbi:MAG: EamA/RhaT family transporter [Alphaproteobacteria bacterium]|nr:MAG: EamA/RhaT family transporter [Alphaproteobacteria bacterium]